MTATSGPSSRASSAKLDLVGLSLRMSLASEASRQTGYALTWSNLGTPAGRSWWVLSMPARPTDASGYGLWATPKASDGERGGRGDLLMQARGVPSPSNRYQLPTPRACSGKRSSGMNRTEMMRALEFWPTPTAASSAPAAWKPGLPWWKQSRAARGLEAVAQMLPTPTARDWKSGSMGQQGNARPLLEVIGGSLNPTWVEWLMGFPAGWTACGASATRLSRKSSP
jgi:hypothetical protein